jgi:adenylate cyclase
MAKEPSHYSMAPLARELTVLFSDVRDFTHISESLAPQDLAKYINEYLTGMSLIIREGHHGTLDKYIGDAIMAFWGAPVTDTQHARNAVNAALKMQAATITISEKVKQLGWPPFKIGIGINTGIMRVGDMGSQIRRAYTVMGDAVNLSSRLEGLTKTYGVGILIGEQTRIQVPEIICREVDKVRVKGKDQPIAIFEPIANEISVEQTNLLTQWHAALQSYRLQEWDKSQRILEELLILDTDTKLYAYYLDRIAVYRINPPPIDGDGVTKFVTK